MTQLRSKRPRPGALSCFLSAVLSSFWSFAAAASSSPAPTLEAPTSQQLRVYGVGDQLVGFLGKVIEWVDVPATRVPTSGIRDRVGAAVLAHPEVRLTEEQKETAAQATREAFSGFLPQVYTTSDLGRRKVAEVSATPWRSFVPAHEDNGRSYGLGARQLLYDFGAVSGKVNAQEAREKAVDARSEGRRSELALRALTAWLELFRAREGMRLAEMNTLSRQQIHNFVAEREQLGGSSKSDVLRVKARLSDAVAAAVAAENRLRAAEAGYREIFDAPPPEVLPLPEAPAIDPARYANLAQWVPKNAILAEARAQTEAARHEAQSAAASLLPAFYLDVSATRRDIGTAPGVVPGTDRTAAVLFRYNLYSGGGELARKRQADQRVRETQLDMESQQRQLERTFAQILADVRNSSAAIQARKDAVQVASVALEAVREQFAFRRGTLLDLLRAQEDLYLAGRDLIDGVVDHTLARYRLLHLSMELTPLLGIPADESPVNN